MTELERIDQSIKVSLDILRHSSSVEGDILRLLEQMRKELIAKLASADLTAWGKARINAMLKDAETTIAAHYAQAQAMLQPTYATVAGVSAAQTATALAVTAPSRAVLESLVNNMLVEGAPMKAWWAKQSTDTAFKFASAVRQGIAQSETLNQIFKRVNDATDLANRNSIALVHTSVMQVFNDANIAVIEQNADVAPTMRWLSTLDSATCGFCGVRDGLEWNTVTKAPIGHDIPYTQPPGHSASPSGKITPFGCRCKMSPVTDLTKEMDKLGIGQRASASGPVARTTTFEDFLKRQTPEWQDSVLGKGRAELWRDKKLVLRDLVGGKGSPLSLAQLKARYP